MILRLDLKIERELQIVEELFKYPFYVLIFGQAFFVIHYYYQKLGQDFENKD